MNKFQFSPEGLFAYTRTEILNPILEPKLLVEPRVRDAKT